MAYNPIPWLPAFKDFDWYPGDHQTFHLSINREILEGDDYICLARSRHTGAKYEFEVTQQGTNAGYLSFEIPGGISGEPSGFNYQIYRVYGNSRESIVASGNVFSRTERPDAA